MNLIEKPIIDEPLIVKFDYTEEEKARFERERARAEELGIELYILDGDSREDELGQLEELILENYIELDQDVPEELKKKYLELKEQANAGNN